MLVFALLNADCRSTTDSKILKDKISTTDSKFPKTTASQTPER